MKIALIAGSFPSKGRPELVFVQQLVWALVDRGIEMIVIAPQSLTHSLIRHEKVLPKFKREQTANGNYYEVYRPYDVSFGNRQDFLCRLTDPALERRIGKILDRFQPDALYGHFWHMANHLTRYANTHDTPLFVACGEGDNALENLVGRLSEVEKRDLVNAVRGVISVSSENKRKCMAFGLAEEDDIVVLPNCVDDTLIHPADGSAFRKELGLADEDFLVLFVGSFVHRKGADRLSAALEKLGDPQIKSVFIGKPMGGDSALPSCGGIVFQGVTDHEYIPKYLCAADVFVLPTLKEGCSNAIVEALASGVPVISSDRPFNADILNPGNSIVIDPEDVDAIAGAIGKMKNDRELFYAKKQYTMAHSGDYSITGRARRIAEFIFEKSAG